MSDLKESIIIKTLCDDYANNHISFTEYRYQRRKILLQLDKDFNQVDFDESELEDVLVEDENILEKQEV